MSVRASFGTLRMMPHSAGSHDNSRAALHGVRGLLLDLDGVLILRGAPPSIAQVAAALF